MKIAIIGSGVVGGATGKGFSAKGHEVFFVDTNPEVLSRLRDEGFHTRLPEALDSATGVSAFFFSLPTPTVDGRIQLGALQAAVARFGDGYLKNTNDYTVVVVRSTTPPGTTEEMVLPLLEKYSGKRAGRDFGLCMNPEYLREGSNERDFANPWLVLIGALDARSAKVVKQAYGEQRPGCPVHVVSLREAEAQKYLHNLYNAMKISFFNEMRMVLEFLRMDPEGIFPEVVATSEAQLNPGYGIGAGDRVIAELLTGAGKFMTWPYNHFRNLPLMRKVVKMNSLARELWGSGNGARAALQKEDAVRWIGRLYNAMKISFFNEMRKVCERSSVDPDRVFPLVVESAEAQWNPAYGIRDLGPFGGSCLPKDTAALLSWSQDVHRMDLPILSGIIQTNDLVKESRGRGDGAVEYIPMPHPVTV